MTLDSIALDTPIRVIDCSGLMPVDKERLAIFGLRPGAIMIKILKTPLGDPIECLVGTQLIVLEIRLMRHICVESV